MHSTCAGKIFALAKPHDSVGKRTRNRIPKEERKTLVESFINKHQNLNNGSFPSLSLTHKEVGGSFYTIREIVREIIQENRVLGPADFEGNVSHHLQDQSPSTSVLIDPVPPLALSQDGCHFASVQNHNFSSEAGETMSPENVENINGSQASPEDRGSDMLNCSEVNGNQLFKEDVGLFVHQSKSSTDISTTQFAASCSEENDTVCDSFATKPQDQGLDVDNKDKRFEEITFVESNRTKPVYSDERVNDAGAAKPEMADLANNTLGTVDVLAERVVETFPLRSVTSELDSLHAEPGDWDKVCEVGNRFESNVETDSNTVNPVDLREISSSTSAVIEENRTEVIVGQIPDHISGHIEKVVEEETSGSCKNGRAKVDSMSSHTRNEVVSVEKTSMEKGKIDASDSSSSQNGNSATLNRIKPESWKETSNMAGHETNPLLAVLKSFLTAFVKFWSE